MEREQKERRKGKEKKRNERGAVPPSIGDSRSAAEAWKERRARRGSWLKASRHFFPLQHCLLSTVLSHDIFHSRLKTSFFPKSFPPQFLSFSLSWTELTDHRPARVLVESFFGDCLNPYYNCNKTQSMSRDPNFHDLVPTKVANSGCHFQFATYVQFKFWYDNLCRLAA